MRKLKYKPHDGVYTRKVLPGEVVVDFKSAHPCTLTCGDYFDMFAPGQHRVKFNAEKEATLHLGNDNGIVAVAEPPEVKAADWSGKEVFTTIEPPSPVNPEVEAIRRTAKLNELKMAKMLADARAEIGAAKAAGKPEPEPKPKEDPEPEGQADVVSYPPDEGA